MLNDLRFRLRVLFRRNVVESELNEELQFHFENQVEKYRNSGMAEKEARRRARLSFGGDDQVKEACREARGTSFLETFFQDIHYGLRVLRKNPSFSMIAALTLALGIGASTAVFSLIVPSCSNHCPIQTRAALSCRGESDQSAFFSGATVFRGNRQNSFC